MNSYLFPQVTASSYMTLMSGGLRFDISALVYLNLIYFVFYYLSFGAKFKKGYSRFLDILFVTINSIAIATDLADFLYYRFTLKRSTSGVIDIFKNEDNMASLWWHFLIDYWYMFALFACFVLILIYIAKVFVPKRSILKNGAPYIIGTLAVFAIVAGLSVAGIRGGFLHSTRPIAMNNAAAYTVSPEESAIVLNTPFCVIRTIGKKSYPDKKYYNDDELRAIYTPIHATPHDSTAMLKRKNVVIFILESFSREFLGSFNPTLENGNYKGYTPFIDSLANHSLIFTNAYANGRKSIDAMPSILASIPALIMPYVISKYGNNSVNSVASLLGEEGYETAFFHGAANGSMGFDGFAKSAGFQRYLGKTEYDNDDDYDGIWGIWDEKFFQYYCREIGNMQSPFCTAVFSLSSHDPFNVPDEYKGKFPKGKLPVEECIGYTDNALRRFFDEAKNQPWYASTPIVITADHSSIPDHDEYSNNAQAFAVPIIFFSPSDSTIQGRDSLIAQQADIVPSILGYLGYNHPFVSFGNDLKISQPDSVRTSLLRYAVNYNGEFYQILRNDTIAYFDGDNIIGVYDMKKDPSLKENIADKGGAEWHEKFVKAYVQQYNLRMIGDSLTVR